MFERPGVQPRLRLSRATTRLTLWLGVIRDSFVTLMPVTFFGLGALLLQNLPWDAYQGAMTALGGKVWHERMNVVVLATHGVMGLVLAPLIAVHLFRRLPSIPVDGLEVPPVVAALSALVNFMLFVFAKPISSESFGRNAMLQGIVVGIASTELLRQLVRVRWFAPARVPYDVESNFYFGIRLTPPVMASGLIMMAAVVLSDRLPRLSHEALAAIVAAVNSHGTAAWLLSMAAAGLNQILWFAGVNGGNMLDVYATDLFARADTVYAGGLASRTLFNSFVLLGGSGATCGLIVAILLVVKQGPERRIAQLSVVPAFFNINELLMYGLPIVLNSTYLIPFICVPLVLCLLTLALVESGWLTLHPVVLLWTTPPLLSGWMLTDSWRGAFVQLIEIGLSAVLYLPFVHKAEADRKKREAEAAQVMMQTILNNVPARTPLIKRHDEVGHIARGLLSDLRDGLNHDRQALSLVYQPMHDREGTVVGVEALLRWRHARYGAISPLIAVTLAEDSEEIHRVGAWVLNEACACKARWNAAGHRQLTMAINLSPIQLTDPDLPARVSTALRMHGLEPVEIELEITESAEIPGGHVVDQTLRQLAAAGVRLSMDDFGMGHSSLLYMQRFPVSSIKLDGSLTRLVLTNSTTADVIRTITALGRSRKVKIVAEFVETTAQRCALVELGCDIFQGYFHSAPLPEQACLDHFTQHGLSASSEF
ncbi:PTS system, lactose/cellobiose family IIC component [Paraburkholderia steynii]|uniref:PTS system, lactose/cellobiose family IIC component n=1 Tax=Paraburkholderia steynii TaxID=1245441 RepID=A0A7Z7BBH2_9BURK|nr:EAL domain-containing protein [Paraburkholderia steynii]SDI57146.1 PTS system, lactose/cellobiose family IIC component [Paraburkholderia steynii]